MSNLDSQDHAQTVEELNAAREDLKRKDAMLVELIAILETKEKASPPNSPLRSPSKVLGGDDPAVVKCSNGALQKTTITNNCEFHINIHEEPDTFYHEVTR